MGGMVVAPPQEASSEGSGGLEGIEVARLPLAEALSVLERHLPAGHEGRTALEQAGRSIGIARAVRGPWPSLSLWTVLHNGAACVAALPWVRDGTTELSSARLEVSVPLPPTADPIATLRFLQAVASGGLESTCGPWLVLSSLDAVHGRLTLTLYPIPATRWLRTGPVGRVLAAMGEDFRQRSARLGEQTLEAEVLRGQLRVEVDQRTALLRGVLVTEEGQRRQLAERIGQLEVARTALEGHNARLERLQALVVRSSQLSAVGEVAAEVAHEGLNALTPVLAVTAQLQAEIAHHRKEHLALLRTIVSAWSEALQHGGIEGLVAVSEQQVPNPDGGTHSALQDDLESLRVIRHDLGQLHLQLEDGIAVAQHNLERVLVLVQQLQQSQPRAPQVLRTQPLGPILEEISAAVALTLREARVRLQLQQPPSTVVVHVDGTELLRVVHNLINNATDALISGPPHADPTITLSVLPSSDAVRLLVSDNGPGITPAHQSRLFQMGFTTKPADKGTGLGLSIAQQLTRGWGGDLRLASSSPQGTTFEVVLPVPPAERP